MAVHSISSVVIFSALLTLHGVAAFAFHMARNPRLVTTTSLDAMSRREVLAASAATLLVAGVPLDALADEDTSAVYSFNGVFKDPKHPKGYRIITGKPGKEGTLILKDDPNGEVFDIPIKAMKDETGKVTLSIDFSSKGGPKDVVATVNKDSSIAFPDGNLWKKEDGIVGVYIDGFVGAESYPKYRRIVRRGEKGALEVCLVSGKKVFEATGKAGKRDVAIDFPGGKTCYGSVDSKKGTISWPDGNIWTKI